jgi:hypothetical protein
VQRAAQFALGNLGIGARGLGQAESVITRT